MVTIEQLQQALASVRRATDEFVALGVFVPGVLTRLNQWINGLPNQKAELAIGIASMAGRQHTRTGADVNGVALDQAKKPSLESLVLYYDSIEPGLFPDEIVASIRGKLYPHNGPLYIGPWP